MMAAVPSAVIPVPLSIATLTVLIAGIPATESTVVFAAVFIGRTSPVRQIRHRGVRSSAATPGASTTRTHATTSTASARLTLGTR